METTKKIQKVSCSLCNKKNEKENAYIHKFNTTKRYYCNENCFKLHEKEISDRLELTDWIQNYYIKCGWNKERINWNLLTAQIKNMINDNKKINMTLSGIRYTLWYLSFIEDYYLLDDTSGSILGLVPSNYIKAREYCLHSNKVKKEISKFELNDNIVIVKKNNKNENNLIKYIDIENL